jgi:hypothetical protein
VACAIVGNSSNRAIEQCAEDLQHGRGSSLSGGFKDLASNPFNARAGQTHIVTLSNPTSHVTVGAHPTFCMGIPVSISTDNIVIANLDVKGDHREIESLVSSRNSAGTWIPQNRVRKVQVKRISDGAVEITPQDELPPGQHVLAGSVTAATGTYDFTVQKTLGAFLAQAHRDIRIFRRILVEQVGVHLLPDELGR